MMKYGAEPLKGSEDSPVKFALLLFFEKFNGEDKLWALFSS